jgi:hypothetical protein
MGIMVRGLHSMRGIHDQEEGQSKPYRHGQRPLLFQHGTFDARDYYCLPLIQNFLSSG